MKIKIGPGFVSGIEMFENNFVLREKKKSLEPRVNQHLTCQFQTKLPETKTRPNF